MDTAGVGPTLREQLSSRDDFVKRVDGPDGFFRVGGAVAIIGLLAGAPAFVAAKWATGLTTLALLVALGAGLCGLGVIRSRIALRRIHAAYLERGWIAAQAPVGLIMDASQDGGATVMRDLSSSGRHDSGASIMLVGGPHTPAAEVEAGAAHVRDWVAGMPADDLRVVRQWVYQAVHDSRDASGLLPVPTGTHLAEGSRESPYTVAIASGKPGQHHRIRHYRIRPILTSNAPR